MSIVTNVSAQAPSKPSAIPEQDNSKSNKAEPMKGRVDAIDDGRLFGWAFDPAAPNMRLTIRVLLDGKPIAEAIADKERPDLKRSGIGDGGHAFDVMLPQFATIRAGELVVIAINGAGVEQSLRVPKPDEQAAEALIAAPMTRILDKLDMLMAAQRQLQVNQRSLQRPAPVIDAAGNGPAVDLVDISGSIEGLRGDVNQRLTELDVHLMRLDGVVAGLEKRIEVFQKRSSGDIKPLFLLLFVLVGFAAGALVSISLLP
ncbi:hypothetical protein CU102_10725 [Phyllobacterium brassicacearum]|uniref:Membrane-anchored protein n=1 Tax=Phyllobacterium brassicacearum TaxID=314235 RepID=A0A2P7BR82_9HYPH|nr:hypothetical protein [Phyllobacterium brassicacearum]PSH68965.1 hypothetical protein CU102_10725 [Phyllobacterium brassicacearum]TDQ33478.1 hypothetical protein DEV91_10527 [Phyllobacterium brassicacearum]